MEDIQEGIKELDRAFDFVVIIINKRINSCEDCPFAFYDSYYDKHQDSGWICRIANRRIIDDSKVEEKKKKNKYWRVPIPSWCPFRK